MIRRFVFAMLTAALLPLAIAACGIEPTGPAEPLLKVRIEGSVTIGADSLPAVGVLIHAWGQDISPEFGGPGVGFGNSTTDDSGMFQMEFNIFECFETTGFTSPAGVIDNLRGPHWACTSDLQEIRLHISP